MMFVNNAPFFRLINHHVPDYSPSLHRLLFSRLLNLLSLTDTVPWLLFHPELREVIPHHLQATWLSLSCFTACNRSTFRTFYVPIFLSVHNSFRLPFLPVRLMMPFNIIRSFIATALLNLTHTTFVATTFLPFFLLDLYIRVFVSGSQPHPCHENFVDPRPIDRTIHLWTAFHIGKLPVWAVLSRLQRAVSAWDIALPRLQRSLR